MTFFSHFIGAALTSARDVYVTPLDAFNFAGSKIYP